MRAILVSTFGGPEVLQNAEVELPQPGSGQIRVRVASAGVNPMDGKIRAGAAFFPVTLPVILGREFAGSVDAIGPGITGVRLGERVAGVADADSGTYAEFALASSWALLPDNVSDDHAATVPIAAGTASRVLDQLVVQPGETLLINGASGTVGSMAVQLAVHRGASSSGPPAPRTRTWSGPSARSPSCTAAAWSIGSGV